jgi:16S rRNA (uracil1498-N3)-methyltransferase
MNHLEWIIEKGTELNATEFWLFPGRLSEKGELSGNQQERLLHLALAAMKQCGRLDLPSIVLKPPLLQWGAIEGTLFFGDTAQEAPFLWEVPHLKPAKPPVVFFVGPEKGFDKKEHAHLTEGMGARGVRVHRNILRTETAPLTALSILQQIIY